MTVSDVSNVTTYTGNNSTDTFSTVFVFYDETDLVVTLDGTVKVLNTDYTVTGGAGASGSVVFGTAPGTDVAIVIERLVAYNQQTDFENFDGNPADVTEKQFDLIVMQTQQLRDATVRALTVPVGTAGFDGELATITANKALIVNSDATGFTLSTDDYEDQATDAAASAAAASASASSASSSASNASTSASNASTSASNASTSETNAATSEANAATSETNAESAASSVAVNWAFDSSTTMADPGTGDLRLNHATVASATAIAVSALTAETGNPDISDYIATWDDGGATTNRGALIIRKRGTPATFAVFTITGSVTDNSTWLQFSVTYVTGNGTFSNTNDLYVTFLRTGATGGGLAAVEDDTSPLLGGNLVVNGFDITSPDGTDLIDIVNGTITVQTNSSSRIDITDSGVRLGAANARVTTILDEDAMGSDSATALATQQSIKAYVDSNVGVWKVIQSQTASASSSIDFTTGINGTYGKYVIEITNVVLSTTTTLQCLVSTNGGSSYVTTNYLWAGTFSASGAAATPNTYNEDDNSACFPINQNSYQYINASVNLRAPVATTKPTVEVVSTWHNNSSDTRHGSWGGINTGIGDIDAVQFLPASGTITSGIFTLYGIANS